MFQVHCEFAAYTVSLLLVKIELMLGSLGVGGVNNCGFLIWFGLCCLK